MPNTVYADQRKIINDQLALLKEIEKIVNGDDPSPKKVKKIKEIVG